MADMKVYVEVTANTRELIEGVIDILTEFGHLIPEWNQFERQQLVDRAQDLLGKHLICKAKRKGGR